MGRGQTQSQRKCELPGGRPPEGLAGIQAGAGEWGGAIQTHLGKEETSKQIRIQGGVTRGKLGGGGGEIP